MSAFMGERASLANRPSLTVGEAKAATRQARQGRAARQTAALEACLDGLQRELQAARLVEQGARQELEDQHAAILEEESRLLASFRRDVEGSCSAQRLGQAEAEAQLSLAQQDAAELGARLQELQGSATPPGTSRRSGTASWCRRQLAVPWIPRSGLPKPPKELRVLAPGLRCPGVQARGRRSRSWNS